MKNISNSNLPLISEEKTKYSPLRVTLLHNFNIKALSSPVKITGTHCILLTF